MSEYRFVDLTVDDSPLLPIAGEKRIGVDTEFMREKTYYPQFCLLQLCNGEVAACIDPLLIDSLDPLVQLLYDPGITKVFHAGRQDLEIVCRGVPGEAQFLFSLPHDLVQHGGGNADHAKATGTKIITVVDQA